MDPQNSMWNPQNFIIDSKNFINARVRAVLRFIV